MLVSLRDHHASFPRTIVKSFARTQPSQRGQNIIVLQPSEHKISLCCSSPNTQYRCVAAFQTQNIVVLQPSEHTISLCCSPPNTQYRCVAAIQTHNIVVLQPSKHKLSPNSLLISSAAHSTLHFPSLVPSSLPKPRPSLRPTITRRTGGQALPGTLQGRKLWYLEP